MSYNKNTWANGDVITAAKMNNIENGIAAAEESGGGYDLVIENDWENNKWINVNITTDQADKLILKKGNFLDLEDKLANGEPINAVLISHGMFSSVMPGTNIADTGRYMHLTCLDGHYLYARFYTVEGDIKGYNSGNSISYRNAEIHYDADTGEIIHAYFGIKGV